jgi:hypothetical protein
MGMEFLVPPEQHVMPPGKHSDFRVGDIVCNLKTGRIGRIDSYFSSGYGSDLFIVMYASGKTRLLGHTKLDRASPEEVRTFLVDEERWQEIMEQRAEAEQELESSLPSP